LIDYLSVCSALDPRCVHFFDECSVIKTTGNRHYGHSAVGLPAVQHYASNANEMVNLLHSIFGVDHVNILIGPSSGLELLNGHLRKNTKLTEDHTQVVIYDALSRVTPEMSRNIFRH
jgi:hypothetical protein